MTIHADNILLRYKALGLMLAVGAALFAVANFRHDEPATPVAAEGLSAFTEATPAQVGDAHGTGRRLILRTIEAGRPIQPADVVVLTGTVPKSPRLVSFTSRLTVADGAIPGTNVDLHSAPSPDADSAAQLSDPIGGLLVAVREAKDGATRVVAILVADADVSDVARMLGFGDVVVVRPP